MSLRRVVHAQIVADAADNYGTRVQPDAHAERHAVLDPHLVGVLAHGVADVQRCVAGALRMIFMRDRRAEQGHDAVAGVLIDRAFEAVHAVRKYCEELVENAVPLLRIELLRQLHRALHVGEEDGDLLALPFEGGLGLEDFFGEMLGGIRARVALGLRDGFR